MPRRPGAKLGTQTIFFPSQGGPTLYPLHYFPSDGWPRPGVGQTWYPTKYFPSEGVPRRPGGPKFGTQTIFPFQGGPRPGGKLCTHYIFFLRWTAKTGGAKLGTQKLFFRPREGQDRGRPNLVPKECVSVRGSAKTAGAKLGTQLIFFLFDGARRAKTVAIGQT